MVVPTRKLRLTRVIRPLTLRLAPRTRPGAIILVPSHGEVGKLQRFIVAECTWVGEPLADCIMGQRLTSEECRVRVKMWLLAGMTLAFDDRAGRHTHAHAVDPWRLDLMSEQECDLQLERFTKR